jgi:hypothetical protein
MINIMTFIYYMKEKEYLLELYWPEQVQTRLSYVSRHVIPVY